MRKKIIRLFTKIFTKKNLNDFGWLLYQIFRKRCFEKKIPKKYTVQIPPMAQGFVFGTNVLTRSVQSIVSGSKDNPTHMFTYIGGGKQEIAEADLYYVKSSLHRYYGRKIVLFYFKDMLVEDVQEIKFRIDYLLKKKLIYDWFGYAGFVFRPLGITEKIKFLRASDTTVFCSDGSVLLYHGDIRNDDKVIRDWRLIKMVSDIYEPNKNAPIHPYLYLSRLHELLPNKVGKIVIPALS